MIKKLTKIGGKSQQICMNCCQELCLVSIFWAMMLPFCKIYLKGYNLKNRKLKFDKISKQISEDVFTKDTNGFTYVLPSMYFPRNDIESMVFLCIFEGFPILMIYLKRVVQNIKTIHFQRL